MKTRLPTNQISICYILLVTGIQLLFAYPEKSGGNLVCNPVFIKEEISFAQVCELLGSIQFLDPLGSIAVCEPLGMSRFWRF